MNTPGRPAHPMTLTVAFHLSSSLQVTSPTPTAGMGIQPQACGGWLDGLPGDLTFSWYAVDKNQQPWVVSFQLNWPRDHGPTVTGWMLRVAKQVFALIAPR
jgi:hypothetical protein